MTFSGTLVDLYTCASSFQFSCQIASLRSESICLSDMITYSSYECVCRSLNSLHSINVIFVATVSRRFNRRNSGYRFNVLQGKVKLLQCDSMNLCTVVSKRCFQTDVLMLVFQCMHECANEFGCVSVHA